MEYLKPHIAARQLGKPGNIAGLLPPYLCNLPTPIARVNYRYHGSRYSQNADDHSLTPARDVRDAYILIKKMLCNEKTKVVVHGRFLEHHLPYL